MLQGSPTDVARAYIVRRFYFVGARQRYHTYPICSTHIALSGNAQPNETPPLTLCCINYQAIANTFARHTTESLDVNKETRSSKQSKSTDVVPTCDRSIKQYQRLVQFSQYVGVSSESFQPCDRWHTRQGMSGLSVVMQWPGTASSH
jgi:hypothetical protein